MIDPTIPKHNLELSFAGMLLRNFEEQLLLDKLMKGRTGFAWNHPHPRVPVGCGKSFDYVQDVIKKRTEQHVIKEERRITLEFIDKIHVKHGQNPSPQTRLEQMARCIQICKRSRDLGESPQQAKDRMITYITIKCKARHDFRQLLADIDLARYDRRISPDEAFKAEEIVIARHKHGSAHRTRQMIEESLKINLNRI